MADILILGLGNTLRSDDGVGVRAVEMLKEKYEIPEGTLVLDGGTRGTALLPVIEGVKKLVVIDAVSSGRQPGALTRQKGEEVLDMTDTMFPHQDTPVELLMAARLANSFPEEVILWGVEPAVLDFGLQLSPVVAARVDELVFKIEEELRRWGKQLRRRGMKQ